MLCLSLFRPLFLSSSLLDVEDLCGESVVPVLQLGKARPFHLGLKPLSGGEEGMTRLLHQDIHAFLKNSLTFESQTRLSL